MTTEIETRLAITYWEGAVPYCTGCSHFHPADEACRCPDCGQHAPCRTHGYPDERPRGHHLGSGWDAYDERCDHFDALDARRRATP